MNKVINGVIARAQELYPGVQMLAFVFMSNHYHMVVRLLGDGAELSNFFGYMQGELSSIIHRLTGVAHDNLWAGRFRVQALLTAEAVLEKIAYTYLNPVAAHLVDKAEHWQGASSWEHLQNDEPRSFKWVTDAFMPQLPRTEFFQQLINTLCKGLEECERPEKQLQVDYHSWTQLFDSTRGWSKDGTREAVLKLLADGESCLRVERVRRGQKVVGAGSLRHQSIYRKFKSREYRKTPLALSTSREVLRQFKERYRNFCDLCQRVWQNWKYGDLSLCYPPGAFIPPRHPIANVWGT